MLKDTLNSLRSIKTSIDVGMKKKGLHTKWKHKLVQHIWKQYRDSILLNGAKER